MKFLEKKIKKLMDNAINNALETYNKEIEIKNFEDLNIINKFKEQNKELLRQLKDCSEKYNKNIFDGNSERTAMSLLKLQYETRIKELEAEVRKLQNKEVKS